MTTLTEELTQNLENVAGTCPACSRHWNLDDSEVKQIKQALATALRGLQMPEKRDMPDCDQMRQDGLGLDEIEQEQVAVVEGNAAIDECQAVITAFVESLVKG